MIKNITKNKIIAEEYVLCDSFFSKLRGLMFSKRKPLVFVFDDEQYINLHMWFVFFPIDVVLLDKDKKVVEIKEKFKPFTFFNSKNRAKFVLELHNGAVKDCKIEVNDIIF
ncbi:DUF192 domain-containing protein [Candidatus Woesearchaeota archaeon]|nr:DUF192 domain-containing protein [Candidatus Woesearchaeota archaeon]